MSESNGSGFKSIREENRNENFENKDVDFNILNTNARSLRPKINSLIDCINEMSATFVVITETWFSDGTDLELETENLLLGHAISIVTRNRTLPPNGLAHGGVAILARDANTKMKVVKYDNESDYEVLVVSASVQRLKRKVFIIGAYIPPGYDTERARGCMQYISDVVLDIKEKHDSPLICVSGDFNQWQVEQHLADYPDLIEILTPPTRNNRRIDRIFMNWTPHESGCLSPLETDGVGLDKRTSDHRIQYALGSMQCRVPVQTTTITYRPFSQRGADSFLHELRAKDWTEVFLAVGPNQKERIYQAIVDDLMNRHFPLKTVKNVATTFHGSTRPPGG